MIDLHLPATIHHLVQGMPYEQITIGYSDAQVYRFLGTSGYLYLKYMPTGTYTSIRHEAAVTKWLRGRLPVAEILAFEEDEQGQYMLTTEITGESAAVIEGMTPEELVKLYAEGLRMIHAISIDDCPFDQSTAVKIQDCLYCCDHGLVKLEYLDESRQDMDLTQLRDLLLSKNLPVDDFVFTHGDYCFPNVIICDNRINGFIDFSIGGVADRYQDIAIGGRSVAYNMKLKYNMNEHDAKRYVALFYQEYGVEPVDEGKIDLYLLIDDFHR